MREQTNHEPGAHTRRGRARKAHLQKCANNVRIIMVRRPVAIIITIIRFITGPSRPLLWRFSYAQSAVCSFFLVVMDFFCLRVGFTSLAGDSRQHPHGRGGRKFCACPSRTRENACACYGVSRAYSWPTFNTIPFAPYTFASLTR